MFTGLSFFDQKPVYRVAKALTSSPNSAYPWIMPPHARPDQTYQPETAALLAWYDQARRDLPWRAKPGESVDPYRVWLSEIMLQQTVVEAVKPYFAKFLTLWPDVKALAAAEDQAVLAAWAGLGYYARARNLIACARVVARDHGGIFPDSEIGLRALPGVGAYTAAAIAAIAFGKRALVVDGNIERVVTRLRAIETPIPKARAEIIAALDPLTPVGRPGDFAQALMDLGAGVCRPKNPDCGACPIGVSCAAHRLGNMTLFPVKSPKKQRPVRHGIAWVVRDGAGRILLRTRPAKGLLGGMAEVPTSEWLENPAELRAEPPLAAAWTVLNSPVIHVFTHFELRLMVQTAQVSGQMPAPPGCRWVAEIALDQEPLPTLMRKVISAG